MEQRGYRLAPVRAARERAEAVRRNDLADAIGDAKSTETSLAAARDRTRSAREALAVARAYRDGGANPSASTGPPASVAVEARTPSGSTPAARLVAAERYIERRRRELADARDAELRAELAHAEHLDDIELARHQLARARAEREVIERHFERWRDTQRKLRERRED